jgi:NAD(P)-dependent dehydrogenase (short-subunit alcohol dehydrogenase family)
VASAGRGGLGPIVTTPLEEWNEVMATNLTGTFLLFKHAGAALARNGGGAMVAISSIAAAVTHPFMGPYCISKAADAQLARNLAVEYGPHNVRVNCISPGLIKTDFARALWENPETATRATATTPLRRIGEPDEIAGAAVFLASAAGSYLTGQNIVVDGGATI